MTTPQRAHRLDARAMSDHAAPTVADRQGAGGADRERPKVARRPKQTTPESDACRNPAPPTDFFRHRSNDGDRMRHAQQERSMQGIDRRRMLREVLCGAAAATVGIGLMAGAGEATPLALEKNLPEKADDLVEEAQWGPGPGPGRWRGRRRWVCWRNRWGRRVCGWR
jgi:hypothetical protein